MPPRRRIPYSFTDFQSRKSYFEFVSTGSTTPADDQPSAAIEVRSDISYITKKCKTSTGDFPERGVMPSFLVKVTAADAIMKSPKFEKEMITLLEITKAFNEDEHRSPSMKDAFRRALLQNDNQAMSDFRSACMTALEDNLNNANSELKRREMTRDDAINIIKSETFQETAKTWVVSDLPDDATDISGEFYLVGLKEGEIPVPLSHMMP